MANRYVYTIVRQDLAPIDTVAQIGHSCLLAGAAYKTPSNSYHIVLQIGTETELIDFYNHLLDNKIKAEIFYEPANASDVPLGWTSITTEALMYKDREIFKNLSLWKPKTGVDKFIESCFNIITRLKEFNGTKEETSQTHQAK